MIHKLLDPERYAISSGGGWLPGAYDSERTARYAFKFSDLALQYLNDKIYSIHGEDRVITMADLKSYESRPQNHEAPAN